MGNAQVICSGARARAKPSAGELDFVPLDISVHTPVPSPTPQQALLAQASWKRCSFSPATLLEFYAAVFAKVPESKRLFTSRTGPEQANLLNEKMNSLLTDLATNPLSCVRELHELGKRHYHYGVRERFIPPFFNSLLEIVCANDRAWDHVTRDAWHAVLLMMATSFLKSLRTERDQVQKSPSPGLLRRRTLTPVKDLVSESKQERLPESKTHAGQPGV